MSYSDKSSKLSEADTCRHFVLPKLSSAGWQDEQIREQVTFTDGRIVPLMGKRVIRRAQKRADYLLRYQRDFTIAVIEAKDVYHHPADGLQQAKQYAEILGLKFAYATNGKWIVEHDYLTGQTQPVADFPSPEALWQRLMGHQAASDDFKKKLLFPPSAKRPLRYYQEIAVNRSVESILQGRKRLLLTMATGTGKTEVAAQICWKLWSSRWNRAGKANRRPKMLFLADRNILVDDPYAKEFAVFGEARHKIQTEANTSREMYFAIYQALDDAEWKPGLYRSYPSDFFDLIIVDECHRGSADQEGNWHDILNYFEPAVQLGMTATPLREDNRDTYLYFGNPLYTYSLKQGIEDGFLAPYRVHRVLTEWDVDGFQPEAGAVDRYERPIPEKIYKPPEFERSIALRARTQAIARHLTDFLKQSGDRFAKTIVFCEDQDHAMEMMLALDSLNADLVQQQPDYVCRITADEGDIGRTHLGHFQDVQRQTPVFVTTSQLLTTGVDVPTCKNIVIARRVNMMTEFKQIIGRGTRVRDDYGKLWFSILDYTGSAVARFADPEFDGYPAFAGEEEIDKTGKIKPGTVEISQPEEKEDDSTPQTGEAPQPPINTNDPNYLPRKLFYDGGQVEIAADLVYDLDPEGHQLRVVKYTDYTAEVVRQMYTSTADLRSRWSDAEQRDAIIAALETRGVTFDYLASVTGQNDADPFDLLCHIAYQAPLRTRRERSDRLRKEQRAFFEKFGPDARRILEEILDKYVELGAAQFKLPDILKLPPLIRHGNPLEIAEKFGGAKKLRSALANMQSMLYAA